MPELKDGELSRRDLGIKKTEVCPQCHSTEIDIDPAYHDGEIRGTRYICRDCGWSKDFEEDGPEDAAESHRQIEQEIITVNALTGWLEGFRDAAVKELRETSDFDKADQKHLQSKIQILNELIQFFENSSDTTCECDSD